MRQSHCHYVDSAVGNPFDRNQVIHLNAVKDRMPMDRKEVYLTWHRFPEKYLLHWQSTLNDKGNPTVAGYDGPSYSDFLPIDFDGEDLQGVHQQVRTFLMQLEAAYGVDGLEGVRAYFSGAKGFHVLLDAALFGDWPPSADLARRLRAVAEKLVGDQPGFDSSIYDKNRLFRMPNTQHGKSGLWKIPLEVKEIFSLSIDEIQQLARGTRQVSYPDWGDCKPVDALVEIWQETGQPAKGKSYDLAPGGSDFVLFPTQMRDHDGRDNAAFAIARYCRKHGFPEARTLELLQMWNGCQAAPLTPKILEQKVSSTYRLAEDATSSDDIEILSPMELANTYDEHVAKLKGRRIELGLPAVDARIRCIVPGEVCTILARSGVGKTMMVQNIIRSISRNHPEMGGLFVSLEQPGSMCFERFAQMATEMGGSEIEKAWGESEGKREDIREAVMEELGEKMLTCVQSVSLDRLGLVLDKAKEKIGQAVDVVLVDYFGMMNAEGFGRTLYEQMSQLARALKQFAKEQDVSLILLAQVSRAHGEEGSSPLTRGSARDTGAVEESADVLLGLYRPCMGQIDVNGNDKDNTISVQILKNRKGAEGETFDFDLDRRSLRITGVGRQLFNDSNKAKEPF